MSAFQIHANAKGPLGYEQYLELKNEYERKKKEEETEKEKRDNEMYELDRFLVCAYMLNKLDMLSKLAKERLKEIEDEWESYIISTILTEERYKSVRKIIKESVQLSELYEIAKSLPPSFKELFIEMHRQYVRDVCKTIENRINE